MIATLSLGFVFDRAAAFFRTYHLVINAQHFGHLFRKLGVAALQVVPRLVPSWRGTRAPAPVRAREHGGPEVALSTIRADSSPRRMFPSAVTHKDPDGKDVTAIEPVKQGADVQSTFFLM